MSDHGHHPASLPACGEAGESKPAATVKRTRGTRSQPQQLELRACPYCRSAFQPGRLLQEFCGRACRKAYHDDVGTEGVVAGVTRIKRGVSVVLHFANGPAAERAVKLMKGDRKRLV